MNEYEIEDLVSSSYEPYILDPSHPAFKSSENPEWKYEEVCVSSIRSEYGSNLKEDILSWFNLEINLWNMDMGEDNNRWLELEKYYILNTESLPLILLKGVDGFLYLNDGHHRHAIAIKNEIKKIWALVAYAK